ncbi:MAG TPA: hypothetical protein VLW50_19700 [Streptosporangiaceae bacterium]|nr:hypothetical protein [Streptosporangiaceae bacterium]
MGSKNYHQPRPHRRDITSITTERFFDANLGLFGVIRLGNAGDLWIHDAEIGRHLAVAAVEVTRLLNPDTAEEITAKLVADLLAAAYPAAVPAEEPAEPEPSRTYVRCGVTP